MRPAPHLLSNNKRFSVAVSSQQFIGFPSGILGDRPFRLPVIDETKDWIAINKPAGVAIRQHPWNADLPDMDTALNRQLQAQKPELLRGGATVFGSVFTMDPEISGVSLFAKHRLSLAELRNLAGSDKLQFKFLLVTKSQGAEEPDERIADAPLLVHNVKPKMIPSTAKGKKARTQFTRIDESTSGWALWEAKTAFPRFHQIRAHASIAGIPVLGDSLYSGAAIPLLSEFVARKPAVAEMHQPVYDGIALHLSEVFLPDSGKDGTGSKQLNAELPKRFRLMLKRLKLSL